MQSKQCIFDAMDSNSINRISAYAPIYMSILALLAAAHSYRGASHEDGGWHIWMLMMFLQVPLVIYFAIASRHQFRKAGPLVATQATLWVLGLIAGALQPAWS